MLANICEIYFEVNIGMPRTCDPGVGAEALK